MVTSLVKGNFHKFVMQWEKFYEVLQVGDFQVLLFTGQFSFLSKIYEHCKTCMHFLHDEGENNSTVQSNLTKVTRTFEQVTTPVPEIFNLAQRATALKKRSGPKLLRKLYCWVCDLQLRNLWLVGLSVRRICPVPKLQRQKPVLNSVFWQKCFAKDFSSIGILLTHF